MPLKRRVSKAREHKITGEVLEAYAAADYGGLHLALGLRPWQCSPLPLLLHGLGVQDGERPDYMGDGHGWELAQELQAEIESLLTRAQRTRVEAAVVAAEVSDDDNT